MLVTGGMRTQRRVSEIAMRMRRAPQPIISLINGPASGGGFGDSSQGMSNAIFCMDGDEEAQARAGKTDILEYPVLGAAIGILVPQLHKKKKNKDLSFIPYTGAVNGLLINYKIR